MKKRLLSSILFGFFSVSGAQAQTLTANLNSVAKLESRCVLSAQNMSFGNLDVMNFYGDAHGEIIVRCSKGISYSITPSDGTSNNASTGGMSHIMSGTGVNKDGLLISLYKDQANFWHRGSFGGGPITGVGNGDYISHPMLAKYSSQWQVNSVASEYENQRNRNAKPDNYSATITAVVTY